MFPKRSQRLSAERGMTFIEITLVISLIAVVSLALYKSLSNGLRIWEKTRELVIEEDIAILFDKFAHDVRNTYIHSAQHFEGDSGRISFPAFVWLAPMNRQGNRDDYRDQLGQVEYSFDHAQRAIVRKAGNYSNIYLGTFDVQQTLASPVDRMAVRYYYLTDDGEVFSENVLGTIPAGVELEVFINDGKGERSMKRYFNIPLKI